MKTNIITFVGASALVTALVIGFAVVRPVLAQVAATSTDSGTALTSPVDTVASSTPAATSTSATIVGSPTPPTTALVSGSATSSAATSSARAATPPASGNSPAAAAASSPTPDNAPTEPPPPGLTLVHINGTKYIDYFTDGSTTIAVPGDPKIDGNLDKPDAPIPTHAGMTWVHTTGQNLYDTPSGDLEVGDYAVQADGSYIQHAPPFVSSTSTPAGLTTSAAAGTETASSASSGTVSPSVPDASTPPTAVGASTDSSSSASL